MKFEVKTDCGTRVWNLNSKLRAILAPMAAEFGWTVEDFLARYSCGSLPGQVPHRSLDDEAPAVPDGFTVEAFAASGPEIWERIKQATEFFYGEESLVECFIWETIWDAVRCAEDDMIFSPGTGRRIGDDYEIDKFEIENIRREEK